METPDDDVEEVLADAAAATGPISAERAERFYDKIRTRVRRYLDSKGSVVEKGADLLFLVPDVFILLWRLTTDSRVSGKNKVLLVSAIAYFIFPFDIIPEALVGPIGYIDDLIFGVYVLNRMLIDTDVDVLRSHWSGHEDVLAAIRRVLDAADSLVGPDFLGKLKKIIK
jgi:uncharacterized membrane protein YkvA (DUF1232 family)